MDKVFIENWPKEPWYNDWISTSVAVAAIIISIVSLYWTRREFIKSSRPFVWAGSYGVIDPERKIIIPIPFRIAFRVKNSPARVILVVIEISSKMEKIATHILENLVRFPDETSEWSFSFSKDEFNKIINRSSAGGKDLARTIDIKYSSLDGGKVYLYKLVQRFEPLENQWQDVSQDSD